MNNDVKLVEAWRAGGPVKWAEGPGGWIGIDGQPVKLTDWQRAILSTWWDNREDVSTLLISNIKKSGKTWLDALLLCWRWLALPGQHFASGNDYDQATDRQFKEIVSMIGRNDYLKETVRVSKSELIFEPTGSILTALASDATGNAGANFITSSHTETSGIEHEGSVRAFEELTVVPGKFFGLPCLRICDSYAGFLGEAKTWQDLVDLGLKGKRVNKQWPVYKNGGVLLFHMTGKDARAKCFRGTAEEAKGYYAEQARTLRPNTFTRYHNNEQTAAESTFLPDGAWAACYSRDVRALKPGENVRLFFGADASLKHDYTALVGVQKVGEMSIVRYVKVWKPVKDGSELDLDKTIGAEVIRLYNAGQLQSVAYDPWQLAAIAAKWRKAGIKAEEMPQGPQRVKADTALYDTVISNAIRHYGNPELNEAVNNAVAKETDRGFRITKETARKKIDACVALSMANFGAVTITVGTMQIIDNPFYEGEHGVDEYVEVDGNLTLFGPGMNLKPHPEGVTWKNCRHNNCLACIRELEAEGYYKKQDEIAQQLLMRHAGQPATEEEAWQDLFNQTNIQYNQDVRNMEAQNDSNIRKNFWRGVGATTRINSGRH